MANRNYVNLNVLPEVLIYEYLVKLCNLCLSFFLLLWLGLLVCYWIRPKSPDQSQEKCHQCLTIKYDVSLYIFCRCLFTRLGKFLFIPSLSTVFLFKHEQILNFMKCLFCIDWYDHIVFLSSVCWYSTLHWLILKFQSVLHAWN